MYGFIAVAGWFPMLAAQAEPAGGWSSRGMVGGFLLSLSVLAWLAIALFFTLAVLPPVRRALEQKLTGPAIVALLENYFLIGTYLLLASVFGSVDLALAAYCGLVSATQAGWWLGLSLFMLLLCVYGRWGLTPGLKTAYAHWRDATDDDFRRKAQAAVLRRQTLVKVINGLQILACVTVLVMLMTASVSPPPSAAEPPRATTLPAGRPGGETGAYFSRPRGSAPPLPARPGQLPPSFVRPALTPRGK